MYGDELFNVMFYVTRYLCFVHYSPVTRAWERNMNGFCIYLRVKVTNQVFRYAKKAGASYINKPKMRHYVHCYALHCLDEDTSNALRRAYKERGENVGAWRQACYKPLVAMAAGQGWDIDAIFNAHPRLSIWYVPTKLRQLCHAERSHASASLLGPPF